MIYLDWNATCPPHEDVWLVMRAAFEDGWGNPASVHRVGQRARSYLDRARASVALLVGRDGRDVILTSGGTEANNLVLTSHFTEHENAGFVVGGLEHPSVLEAAYELSRRGAFVRVVPPEPDGRVTVERVTAELERVPAGTGPVLVSLQAVNHETGVIQPVTEVTRAAHARGARMHVDAVQAAGKLDPAHWDAADFVVVASHKLRGPKGIGALVTMPHIEVRPQLRGGAQERGLRAGTQDAHLAAGFAVACERAAAHPLVGDETGRLRDRLEEALVRLGEAHGLGVVVNGTAPRLPSVSNVSVSGWRSAELAAALDLEGVAVSSGAACSAGTPEPSRVISAMLGPARAAEALRLSLGEATTEADVDGAIAAIERVFRRCR